MIGEIQDERLEVHAAMKEGRRAQGVWKSGRLDTEAL